MKLLILVITFAAAFTSCAQSKITVKKSYAFLRQNSRGTLAVDENNNPVNTGPDSEYIAYVELSSTVNPAFTKAWINQQTFNVSAEKVNQPITVATARSNGETIKITTQPNNTLWQLSLQKSDKEPIPSRYASSASPTCIIVKGLLKKQDFYIVITPIIHLEPVIYP